MVKLFKIKYRLTGNIVEKQFNQKNNSFVTSQCIQGILKQITSELHSTSRLWICTITINKKHGDQDIALFTETKEFFLTMFRGR